MQQTVLSVVAAAGLIAAASVVPNAFQALSAIVGKQRYKLAFQTKTAFGRLIAKGHLRLVERNGRRYAEITEAGKRALRLELARNGMSPKKRRWDGRYRLVMFDISEKRKTVRDRLRLLMKEFGFLRVQDSVWLAPYDCEEIVALAKADLRVGKEVLYGVLEHIENDGWIREHFGLK